MPKVFLVLVAILWSCDALPRGCQVGSIDERFAKAAAVFHVRVTVTELKPSSDLMHLENFPREEFSDDEFREMPGEMPNYVRVSFQVVEVFKGKSRVPDHLYELTFAPGNCGPGLMAGVEYVIFSTVRRLKLAVLPPRLLSPFVASAGKTSDNFTNAKTSIFSIVGNLLIYKIKSVWAQKLQ